MESKVSKVFQYPGNKEHPTGSPMCEDGLFRAALLSHQFQNGELTLDQLHDMARTGLEATARQASTHKRNLIHFIVYRHARVGDLDEYVDKHGNFLLNNGVVSNLDHPRHDVIRRNLAKNWAK